VIEQQLVELRVSLDMAGFVMFSYHWEDEGKSYLRLEMGHRLSTVTGRPLPFDPIIDTRIAEDRRTALEASLRAKLAENPS
jgi:hypothetical protein